MQTHMRDVYDDCIRRGYDPTAIICHPDDVGRVIRRLHLEAIPIDYIFPTDSRDRGGYIFFQSADTMEDEINDDEHYRLITLVIAHDGGGIQLLGR